MKIKLLLLLLITQLIACVAQSPQSKKTTSFGSNFNNPFVNNDSNATTLVTYTIQNSFWVHQNSTNQGKLSLPNNYADAFYLKGNQLNEFLSLNPNLNSLCMIAKIPNSQDYPMLVLSGRVRRTSNFMTGKKENYLFFQMNEANNISDCGTTQISDVINNLYSESAAAFVISQVCTNCTIDITTQSLRLFKNDGIPVDTVPMTGLSVQLNRTNTGGSSSGSSSGSGGSNAPSCSSSSTCVAQGYSCCLQGQCVVDGALKAGVDTESDEYLAIASMINLNPNLYINYPAYYYVCSTQPNTTPGNLYSDGDPIVESNNQLEFLKDLYDCITPDSSGVSICSTYYSNASTLIDTDSGSTFEVGPEDQNFSFTGYVSEETNNIVEVRYGGQILYKEGVLEENETVMIDEDTANDDLDSAQSVTISSSSPTNAINDILSIKFRINGTCNRVNAFLARCTQLYIQGQSSDPALASDHDSSDYSFRLPSYASTEQPILVKVNGVNTASGSNTWTLEEDDFPTIAFVNPIYPNQTVEITYYVADDLADQLLLSREAAQNQVNTFCNCGDGLCGLQPVYQLNQATGEEDLASFNCIYPQTTNINVPLQQTVYVSSKSVPHRFFDQYGVNYDSNRSNQLIQEGYEFKYINSDQFKPNNLEQYVGFNEIYGSFNSQANAAKPAEKVNVIKGRNYNIYVDTGSFSSCVNCGSDYYSSLQKIFPGNFTSKGGGYTPDFVETRRFNNTGTYRADDLIYGRACFLPATMIPFAHQAYEDILTQRGLRLASQHFYFANGYQRDWFGFDYGSLIGSFDGVKWFSIGNQRSIKASTNRLYLAINAYYGDITANNSFKVVVSENVLGSGTGVQIDHDMESDGAQCQQFHICDTDNDCIKNLGYEYSCESVTGIQSSWPVFDINANELPGQTDTKLITSLINGTYGQPKRCVYRGRGAPCLIDPYDTSESYTGSSIVGLHSCAPNYRCQAVDSAAFNTRISRFPRSTSAQNSKESIVDIVGASDTFGLGSRILGRPLNYYGQEEAPAEVVEQLSSLLVAGICVPGKAADATDLAEAHSTDPSELSADKVLGIGSTTTETFSEGMYSMCPATDEDGHYIYKEQNYDASNVRLRSLAASQNIASNVLQHSDFSTLDIFNDINEVVTTKGIHKNTCLRAPGAACFTDLDCAPSEFIADKVARITDPTLNQAEIDFWKEELVCGQVEPKYQALSINMNPAYDLNQNRCCRMIGKEITIHSAEHEDPLFYADKIAGQDNDDGSDIPLDSDMRYSRVHTIYDKVKSDSVNYPALISPKADPTDKMDLQQILKQYNTFHLAASRTCCSGHWVRNFADENGGGHHWVEGKIQNIPKSSFKCVNWFPDNEENATGTNKNFECSQFNWQSYECEARNLTNNDQSFYLKWLEKLELIGIPQIPIETNQDMYCLVDDNQNDIQANKEPLKDTIKKNVSSEIIDGNKSYYSAGDLENFETGSGKIKPIFSDNKVSCCLPSGQNVDSETTDEMCCTGKVFQNRCCLEDYTDLTLYLNRYVSSEAADLPDSQIDPQTGYIKDPSTVLQIANQKNLCCSGKAVLGYAISPLMIPGVESIPEARVNRFVSSDNLTDNNNETGLIGEIYNKGVRWNNHVYCVPDSFTDPREE